MGKLNARKVAALAKDEPRKTAVKMASRFPPKL